MLPPDSQDPIERRLDEWAPPDPPADLESRVWRQVSRNAERSATSRFSFWALRAAAAVLCVAAGAGAVGLAGEWRLHQLEKMEELQMVQDYGQLLRPVSEPNAGPATEVRLERDLLWLRRELNLSPAQVAQLRFLHENSNERLLLLAEELAQARSTEAHWETERKTKGDVDFLSYAYAAKGADTLSQMSAQTTQSLINSAAAVLNSGQRQHYLSLLKLTEHPPGGHGS